MSRKIKILYLVDGFNIGGAETNLLQMLRVLNRDRYDITLCSFMGTGDLRSAYEALGLPLLLLERRWRFDLSPLFRLYRLIKQGGFDIVQTLLFYPDILGAVMARLCRVPVCIAWETASHYDAFFKPQHRRLFYRTVMRWATRIVAVSAEAKQSIIEVEGLPGHQIDVVPNGIDPDRFDANRDPALRRQLVPDEKAVVLGVVARLDYIKGHAILLEALDRVRQADPHFVCLLVGDGPCRQDLETQVQTLDLQAHVRFLGFRRDVPEILGVLDLFILPSLSEGLPNVVLEALASRVAVVSSAVGGIPEVVRHGENGMLVPAQDVQALAGAILGLMREPALRTRLGEAGRKLIQEQYSYLRQVEAFERLYQKTLDGGKPTP